MGGERTRGGRRECAVPGLDRRWEAFKKKRRYDTVWRLTLSTSKEGKRKTSPRDPPISGPTVLVIDVQEGGPGRSVVGGDGECKEARTASNRKKR